MVKNCKWHKAMMYSLAVLAVVVFSYAITNMQSISGLANADELDPVGPVTTAGDFPSHTSTIPTTYSPFIVYFSGPMNELTLNTDTVKLFYVEGELINYISGTVAYDSAKYAVTFTPDAALPGGKAFTFDLTVDVSDAGDNAVGPYSLQFSTNEEEDNDPPGITAEYPIDSSINVDLGTSSINLSFDEPLNPLPIDEDIWESDVAIATFDTYYNRYDNEIVIPLEADTLVENTTYTITFDGSLILDASGNPLGDDYVLNFTTGAHNETAYDWDDPANKMWNPIYVWADGSLAGLTTAYHFSFPITESMDDGNKIAITFPEGFDIGDASITGFWENGDINNWEEGTVSIESISVDEISNIVTVTLNSDSIFGEETENLYFTIGGIVNSSTPSQDYTLSYTTKLGDGTTIEGPNDFHPTTIVEAGSGVATILVLENGTEDPIEGATIIFNNWTVGQQTIVTDENGEASISGIPVQDWGTDVYAWMDGSNTPDGYKQNWASQNIHLTTESPEASATIYLDAANLRISGTISHAGVGEDGETNLSVWASSQNGWTNKTITLDVDGSTDYTLYLSDSGRYNVGVNRDWSQGGSSTFITPSPVERNLGGDNTSENPLDIDFTLESADKVILINVTDQNGDPIPQVWCSVSSDYAMSKKDNQGGTAADGTLADSAVSSFWTGAQSDSDGVCTVNVREGRYKIQAYMQGISGQMAKSVVVGENDDTVEVDVVIEKPSIAVSGTITDENGDGIENASVNCHETTKFDNAWTNTDVNGDFIFYVNEGTWTCESWAQNIGFVPAAEGVDVTDFDVSEDVIDLNFAYDPDAFANITGTLLDSNSEPKTNTSLWAERINTGTNQYVGYGNSGLTDSEGSFSIRVPKNDSDETYRVQMWDPSLGQFMFPEDADASGGDVDLGTITLPQTYEVTVTMDGVPEDQYFANVNIENISAKTMSWAGTSLTDGSGSTTVQLPDGDYVAHMWMNGFGESRVEFSVSGDTATVDFDFSDMVFEEYNITVTDEDGPVGSAYVEAFDPINKSHVSSFTDGNGVAVLRAYVDTDSAYEIRANSPSHVSKMVTVETGITDYEIILTSADSTISGIVTDEDGDELPYAWVDAMSTDGTSWVGTMAEGDGSFSLAVPSSTTWNIFVHSFNGTWGTVSSVAAGTEDVALVSDQSMDYFIPEDPFSITINPTEANVITTDIVELNIPAGALGSDTDGITININKTTAVAETENSGPLGKFGFEITATDSSGNNITSLNDDIIITVKINKEQVEAILNDLASEVTSIEDFIAPIGYYDEINQGWTDPTSSITIEVQESEGDDYEVMTQDEFISNFQLGVEYNDFIIKYIKSTDHLTIFAPIVGNQAEDEGGDGGGDDGSTGGNGGSIIKKKNDLVSTNNPGIEQDSEDKDYVNHWSKDYIKELFDRSLVTGCGNGNFCPSSNITRAEILKIAMNVYGITVEENIPNVFTDIDTHWAKDVILTANKLGMVSGYKDKTFKPNERITRSQALKILFSTSSMNVESGLTQDNNPFTDVKLTDWYSDYAMTAYKIGVFSGYQVGNLTYFNPSKPITRGEVAKLALMIEKYVKLNNTPTI